MRKSFVLFGLMAFFLSLPVFAQQDGNGTTLRMLPKEQVLPRIQSMADKMPQEWLACHQSEDCGLVAYNCFAEELAANKAHLKDAQGVICRTELCSWLQCAQPLYSFSAACEENQCVTKIQPFKSN